MGVVNVADFEACALAGQTTGSKGRKTTLVRDFRQRIGLVHELRELAGSEELFHHRRNRLLVDQVVRHERFNFLNAHTFLDRAFHANQTDAVLVLDELTHRANAAVTEVIDIVDRSTAVVELAEVLQGSKECLAW